jgi:hypothetical protein
MVEASKRFGLTVEVVPGAATRGSPAFNPYGFVGHHTAGARTGDRPSLNLCVNGRADLSGPLCNDFLTRAGVDVIVAAGRANHAGLGGFRGLVGNSAVWGCEAEDEGDGTWTGAQWLAYPRLVAARLWMINRDASWYCSHRTWAPTRKIDPTGITDAWMQKQVAALLANPTQEDDMAFDDDAKAKLNAIYDYTRETRIAANHVDRMLSANMNLLASVPSLVQSLGVSQAQQAQTILATVGKLPTAALPADARAQIARDIAAQVADLSADEIARRLAVDVPIPPVR